MRNRYSNKFDINDKRRILAATNRHCMTEPAGRYNANAKHWLQR